MFKSQKSIMAAAMASAALGIGHRVFGAANIAEAIDRSRKAGKRFVNRSKYMPHQGEREIARRLRQEARNIERQKVRASYDFYAVSLDCDRVSRRGRLIRA